MKIDVTQTLKDLDGQPIGKALRDICLEGITGVMPEDRDMSIEDKGRLFHMAVTIHDEDAPDLTLDEWAKVRARIGKAYGVLVVGQVLAMLDGPKPKAAETA